MSDDTIIKPKRNFCHTHVHDIYSVLDGISRPEDLIAKCKRLGMTALARTNHGNLFQSISFYKSCMEAGIIPVLGQEFYVAPDSMLNRTYAKKSEAEEDAKNGDLSYSAYHLTVLAKNRDGYENLKKLSTIAWQIGHYRKPRIDDEALAANKDGLIVLSGCLAGKIAKLIIGGAKDKALEEIDKMRGIFGEDFYLEVMNHNTPEEKIVVDALKDFSKLRGIPMVMTGDSHFTEHGDRFAHDVALAVGTGKNINDPDRFKFNGSGYWFKSPDEMYDAAEAVGIPEEALTNTVAIANKIEDYGFKLTSKTKKSIIPLFRVDENTVLTDEQCVMMLEMKARQGLAERKLAHLPEYQDRLKEELDLITKKQFSSYFLIIADIIDFMRKKGRIIPIGRGSAGGSLVCYSLFITGLDPIRLKLSFSRFMNEGRKDLPDIDTDISQRYRGEVIEYIVNKYGKDRVAHIVTFQSMASKAASDNVGRGLGIPSQVRAGVGKLIGDVDKEDKLADILEDNIRVKEKMSEHPNWIDVAQRLEGNIKNLSAHAAGIVISNDPIINHVPLIKSTEEGYLVTQFDMKDLGELGLLKLDMLGLKTLDVIQDTIELVQRRHGINLNFHDFPIWDGQDPATYATIASGKYVSCFQYDSHGIRGAARAMAPTKFDHLVALNALYRPGPMKRVGNQPSIMEQYIERRHGRQACETWHPELNDIFKETYGLPLFQESIMSMARVIAGFNETEADEYRAAIGKKDKIKFAAAQVKFKERGIKLGRTPELMDSIIAKLEGFARYGWNKSHSCLRRGTKVLTCARGWVDIQDVKMGERLWSVRHDTGNLFANKVVNVINNGIRGVRRISANDRSIDCTDTHPFLSSKQKYIYASEIASGDRLEMLKQGASLGDLNGNMTSVAHGDQVPFGIRLNNTSRDNMVQSKLFGRSAEYTHVIVPGQHLTPERLIETSTRAATLNTRSINCSQEIKYRTGPESNTGFTQPSRDSGLIGNTRANHLHDSQPSRRSDNFPSITSEAPLFNVPTKGCFGCLERKRLDDISTREPFRVESNNQVLVNKIGVNSIPAFITGDSFGPFTGSEHLTADTTWDNLSVNPTDMDIAVSSNCIGWNTEYPAADTTNFVSHEKIINNWNVDSNITLNETDEVWDLMMEEDPNFIANGFIVHNCSYSYISFVTAHLETHYPLEYYTTLLNVNSDENDKLKIYLAAIIQKGIKIYPPHINKSGKFFETDGASIYMGIYSIRQLGDKSVGPILDERTAGGPYLDYADFCVRMGKHSTNVKKDVKENLVKAGAFSWDNTWNQKTLVTNTELIQLIVKKFANKLSPEEIRAQIKSKLAPCDTEYTEQEKLNLEQAVLNFYISSHPVLQYQALFNLFPYVNLITPSQLNDQGISSRVVMLGLVEEKAMKTTKKGDPFLSMKLGDNLGQIQQNIWSPLATQCNPTITVHQLILIHGQVKEDKFRIGDNQLSVNGIMPITATHGLPITSFYAIDIPTANRIAIVLGVTIADISDRMLNQGHLVTLRGTAYIKPEMADKLRECGRAHYILSI